MEVGKDQTALVYLEVQNKKARFCVGLSRTAERRKEMKSEEMVSVKKTSYKTCILLLEFKPTV